MPAMIRASYTKLALKYLKQNQPQDWAALCARIGEERLATIRAAGPIAWLPAEHHVAVADATIDLYGLREARAAWREVMLAAFERSMLSALVSGALRVYGAKPSSLMRMTPQAWSLVWRDCGKVWMEDAGEAHAVMRFEGLPPVLAQSPGVVESFVANCDAAIAYVKCHGKVSAHRERLARGELSIDVTWMARG